MIERAQQLIGWDVGGAHLKAVLLSPEGQAIHAKQLPCALWMGLDKLNTAMEAILKSFDIAAKQAKHIITMTGELVDLFENRHDGVVKISTSIVQVLGEEVLFYAVDDEKGSIFFSLDEALLHTSRIASANWHASASLLANNTADALLIDIGSTTTDIVAIEAGRVADVGLTDAARMQHDTLVYTGVVRTPVMAVAQKLMVNGVETNVAAEYFATMADVYRLTGELRPEADMADTADGQEKTVQASAKRLARMVGYDVEDQPMACWQQFAQHCREKQMEQIQLAAMKQVKKDITIVGAGAGAFLAQAIALRLNKPYVALSELFQPEVDLAVCLPAYAVAKLALFQRIA